MQGSTAAFEAGATDFWYDIPTHLLFLVWLIAAIWSVASGIQFWWLTSTLRGSSKAKLSRLWESLTVGDLNEARRLSSKIAKRLPESGLSAWSSLKTEDPMEFVETFSAADVDFHFKLSRLRGIGRNILRLMVLVLIATGSWLFDQASKILRGVELSKTVGISALAGALNEQASFVSVSLCIVALMYILRWNLMATLDRRRCAWDRFAGMLRTLPARHGKGPSSSQPSVP